jgi:hypothetical protein
VARLSEIPEEARPLVNLLVDQQLLATDIVTGTGEVTIEPAHEALLRQWGLLQTWLVEDSAALTTLESIKRAARDWETNGKDASWLIDGGGRLEDAERLRPDLAALLAQPEWTYLAACRTRELEEKQREEQRRKRELEEARKLAKAQKKILPARACKSGLLAHNRGHQRQAQQTTIPIESAASSSMPRAALGSTATTTRCIPGNVTGVRAMSMVTRVQSAP